MPGQSLFVIVECTLGRGYSPFVSQETSKKCRTWAHTLSCHLSAFGIVENDKNAGSRANFAC